LEQVNIAGKRSGEGFVVHKDTLVDGLARAQAERVMLFNDDITLGRRGFLAYLRTLAGNIVKIVPAADNASGKQVVARGVRVVCGNHQSYLPDLAWIVEKTPLTFNTIRVSPSNAITPNLGSSELAEVLSKVVPFASSEEARPILQTIRFFQKDGKLTLTGADGYVLAEAVLDLEAGEGEALVYASELKGLIPALKKARRVKVGFEQKADDKGELLTKRLLIDTELVRYKLQSQDGSYPDYGKVFPGEHTAEASFDAEEVIRASRNLLSFWYDDSTKPLYRALTLTIGEGKVVLQAKEDRGRAVIEADTSGQGEIAVGGKYLLQALKTCGGIVNLQMTTAKSPMLFSSNGLRCLVMPMLISEQPPAEAKAEAKAEPKAVAEAEAIVKAKARGRGRKATAKPEGKPEPAAVA
jgi:DNA polymerase III sliding clamp (beta) subunit (PCNA family)